MPLVLNKTFNRTFYCIPKPLDGGTQWLLILTATLFPDNSSFSDFLSFCKIWFILRKNVLCNKALLTNLIRTIWLFWLTTLLLWPCTGFLQNWCNSSLSIFLKTYVPVYWITNNVCQISLLLQEEFQDFGVPQHWPKQQHILLTLSPMRNVH